MLPIKPGVRVVKLISLAGVVLQAVRQIEANRAHVKKVAAVQRIEGRKAMPYYSQNSANGNKAGFILPEN
jgi:hypothetical protein